MTTKTPTPVFRKVTHVTRWVRDHVSPHNVESGDRIPKWTPKTLGAAVLWWYVYQEADNSWGDLRVKDIANILLKGVPKMTLINLQESLDGWYEEATDTEVAETLEASLRAHFDGLLL